MNDNFSDQYPRRRTANEADQYSGWGQRHPNQNESQAYKPRNKALYEPHFEGQSVSEDALYVGPNSETMGLK